LTGKKSSGLKWGDVERYGLRALPMMTASTSSVFYAGEFRHQVDDKNRVTIPSRWRRNSSADDLIMVPEPNGQFLVVLPPNEFEKIGATAETMEGVSKRDLRIFLRRLHSQAQHGSFDKQGRLLLPDEFCQSLDLKGEVVLVGGRGRFEIWNLNRRNRAHADEHPTYQAVANLIGL
jgi:MraZ protein